MATTKTYDYSALADALIGTGAVSDLATDDNGWKRLVRGIGQVDGLANGDGSRYCICFFTGSC